MSKPSPTCLCHAEHQGPSCADALPPPHPRQVDIPISITPTTTNLVAELRDLDLSALAAAPPPANPPTGPTADRARTQETDDLGEPRVIRSYIAYIKIYREISHLIGCIRGLQHQLHLALERMDEVAATAKRDLERFRACEKISLSLRPALTVVGDRLLAT
ncbi:hypothetical protein EXIGLDRAFT_770577 [Exidia glandulosa HHB12029]|uniref:EGF-like domain-containing protein n=1 Tax=Exidia glandulosa HHB12029 TaxID=1314781 RepID=A0A166ACP2_EXIGL|nr:hypothetical protein EXIGLDRAFT_770577 [Exidia glandulosa HHB12029]